MIKLTKEHFNEALAAAPRNVVVFASHHCAPCKQLKPILEMLEEEASFPLFEVAAPDEPELVARFSIVSVPQTIVIDEHGHEVARMVGGGSISKIEKFLADAGVKLAEEK